MSFVGHWFPPTYEGENYGLMYSKLQRRPLKLNKRANYFINILDVLNRDENAS
jgi:hypothetical protein